MSNKPKLNVIDVKIEEDKKGNKIAHLKTTFDTKKPLCKECKKNPRQESSSRCKECSDTYKSHQINNSRLERKIENQKVEKDNIKTK